MNKIVDGFKLALGFALGLSCLFAAALIAQSLTSFASGEVISAAHMNNNFNAIKSEITAIKTDLALKPPVGSIVAWHKNLTGVSTTLPDGWLECNGQTVSDSASALDGVTLPNLNGTGRFLRGSGTSGTDQSDAFQGHLHNVYPHAGHGGGTTDGAHGGDTGFRVHAGITSSPITDGSNGTPRTSSETRPINMSVVWIIRIK